MKCSRCREEFLPIRIRMNNHVFCSPKCVVAYAGTNKNVPWIDSEAYEMYYNLEFDKEIKGVLSDTGEEGPKDEGTGCSEMAVASVPAVELNPVTAEQSTVVDDSCQTADGTTICLCRSGVLDVYKRKVVKAQESRQGCANKVCSCYPIPDPKDGNKGSK